MEKEKILEALETIKKLCSEVDSCNVCPLGYIDDENYGNCMLEYSDTSPNNWHLNTGPLVWRAFTNH